MAVDYSINTSNVAVGSGGGYVTTGSAATPAAASASGAMTAGSAIAVAGLISAYGQSQATQAAAIQTQTANLVAARDALVVAGVRADMSEQYARIQSGRILKKAELEAQNYTIAGNQLLKNLRSTNASIRARAAASGVAYGEGSAQAVQNENTRNVQNDVAIADLNALTARVYGFEDATALIQSTEYQNFLNNYTAQRQAGQYEMAGNAARSQGGLLSNYQLASGGLNFARTYKA
jgi:hypothetical protein